MIPTSLRNFIDELIKATDESKIKWIEGAPETYLCNHKNYKLYISHISNIDTDQVYFSFTVDKNGKESKFFVESFEDDYSTMSNLYSSISINVNDISDITEDFFAP
ncbi:hypothetical protein [Ochrobactrum sp. Marseille-Q0166]|uniref:hypothetical protein n=1 Tax=Ochrobactrum sp. Marseille-Q0166 TaxID=2761105 RepID=UPI00165527BF|nr:hypothetical protein [Ochrobactrum sp. Marseille-Q0166]MBC8718172.1 hypothetical protein [Ochrobactrum sp. Marseille-Q0166]